MKIEQLQPAAFFRHFAAISAIPRGSGNEEAVSHYVANFARDLGLRVVQDSEHNVIVYKLGTPGYEQHPAVMLQGHLDMVCEKNAGTTHDFTKDPLDLYVEGEGEDALLRARGTTLGADNGTAVAFCMMLMESGDTIPHPPLEMVLTTNEETGMEGAQNLDAALFTARRMINLDSSTEGTIVVGCAAGVTTEMTIPTGWVAPPKQSSPAHAMQTQTIKITGLQGGHSGGDIAKGRGNALVLLGEVLSALKRAANIDIVHASGGMKINAIPREAQAVVCYPAEHATAFVAALGAFHEIFEDRFRISDPDLLLSVEEAPAPTRLLARSATQSLIDLLLLLPKGVQAMSQDIPGLVNASCNVGVLETTEDALVLSVMPRGGSQPYVDYMEAQMRALARLCGAQVSFIQRSPAWPVNPDSPLLKTIQDIYTTQYNQPPRVTAIHAGLECGILGEKLPGLDIVAMGPTTYDLHTPQERTRIASVGRFWTFLQGVLAAL